MMEALSFGIPILSFPDRGHSEQENNPAVIEEEGYGRMGGWEEVQLFKHPPKSYSNVFGKFSKKRGTGIKLKDCEDLPENWTGLVL